MTRVAFLIPGLDRLAGAERQVIELASRLARRGWRVSVVALSGDGGDAAQALAENGVEFLTLCMRKGVADPRGWVKLHRWLRATAPEILHAHLPHASWMARISRLFTPARIVIDTIHTSARPPLGRRIAYRLTASLSNCITAVAPEVAEAWARARIARPEGTIVIPNGIDTGAWAPSRSMRGHTRQQLGIGEEFLWCAVGRLEPVKDHATLLHAMAFLPAHAHLVVVGSGSLEHRLRGLSRELQIESRVHFPGHQPDPRRWFQAADAFVLSSLWEGLPISLLEAGACALPSAATDVSGVREILAEDADYFIARPGNPQSLRTAMARLMEVEPTQRIAMGIRARQRVSERFGMNAVLDAWERLYRRLLAQAPHPSRLASSFAMPPHSAATPPPERPA